MNHQLSTIDRAEMHAGTEDGIERGYLKAQDAWKREVRAFVVVFAQNSATFTANDLRDGITGLNVETPDGRALGGVLRSLASEGIIEPTNDKVQSVRGHKCWIQVWRSKIYQPPQEQGKLPL